MRFFRKLTNYLFFLPYRFRWRFFRWRYSKDHSLQAPNQISESEQQALNEKEAVIQEVITAYAPSSFLEIGIGGEPVIDRLKLFQDRHIAYTGCDFAFVCRRHKNIIEEQRLNSAAFRFLSNEKGTYSWTLFEIMQKGEKFDMIYIDGHHTFYVDLPAFILADQLLKEGGYLMVDDTVWTLDFMKGVMARFVSEWYLYRNTYHFDEYTPAQQKIPHIGMIVDELLVKKLHYAIVEKYSYTGWSLLRKNIISSSR